MLPWSSVAVLLGVVHLEQVACRPLAARSAVPLAQTNLTNNILYSQPNNFDNAPPGQLLYHERVDTIVLGKLANSSQIKYVTTDNTGKRVSTVATLWSPAIARSPPAVLSYQYAEDSLNLACAPSLAWIPNSGSNNSAVAEIEGPIVIPWALAHGYHVVQPNAEGPASTWMVGRMEGRAVLDGIRAAIQFNGLDISRTQVAMYGYSGAAHSTVWAATLSIEYAPELNIIGAAYGGTPVDLMATFEQLNSGPDALLAGGGMLGVAAGYSALETYLMSNPGGLNAAGKSMATQLRTNNYCLNNELNEWANTNFDDYLNTPITQNEVMTAVARNETLLMNATSLPVPVPKFPRLQYHGSKDVTVPYGAAKTYVEQQCAAGANIEFRTYEGADHAGGAIIGIVPALIFIDSVFAGIPPNVTCGTTQPAARWAATHHR